LYFTANPNGQAEVVTIYLRHKPKLKKPVFDLDFSELAIKGRGAAGNQLTKHKVRKIVLKDQGISTLTALNLWFDENVLRLNVDKRGKYIGAFKGEDKILAMFSSGTYRTMNYELSAHFEENPLIIEKYNPERIITAVYQDVASGHYYIKRFQPDLSEKFQPFIPEDDNSKLVTITAAQMPLIKVKFVSGGRKQKPDEEINVHEFIAIKGIKAKGKRLSSSEIETVEWMEPLVPEPDLKPEEDNAQGEHEKDTQNKDNNKPSGKSAVIKNTDADDDLDAKQIKFDF